MGLFDSSGMRFVIYPFRGCLIVYVDAWSIIRDRWVESINSILNHD